MNITINKKEENKMKEKLKAKKEQLRRTRFFSKLNRYWKRVRNICLALSTILGAIVGSEYFQLIETDELLYKVVKYGLFVTSTIVLVAQNTKE